MTANQQKRWTAARQETLCLKDGFGMPVDPEVVDVVTALRLLGFLTTMSCGGHVERFTGGPYVMFTSNSSIKLSRIRNSLPADQLNERKKLDKEVRAHTLMERLRLFELLSAFYEERQAAYLDQLIVVNCGITHNRLQCLGAELGLISLESSSILEANQAETQQFGMFLKEAWLSSGWAPDATEAQPST